MHENCNVTPISKLGKRTTSGLKQEEMAKVRAKNSTKSKSTRKFANSGQLDKVIKERRARQQKKSQIENRKALKKHAYGAKPATIKDNGIAVQDEDEDEDDDAVEVDLDARDGLGVGSDDDDDQV